MQDKDVFAMCLHAIQLTDMSEFIRLKQIKNRSVMKN